MAKLDLTKPGQTRNGLPVRILATDLRSACPVVGFISYPDHDEICSWTLIGTHAPDDNDEYERDLFNVPVETRRYFPTTKGLHSLQCWDYAVGSCEAIGFETAAFTRDDRDNPVMHEKHIPKFVADNSNLLLTILTKAFGARSDNAEALGVDAPRRQAPAQYLILEVNGPFDPYKATVYDALDGGASWVCTTAVDPRTMAMTLRSLYNGGWLDRSQTEAQDLAAVKERARNLASALGVEGWV